MDEKLRPDSSRFGISIDSNLVKSPVKNENKAKDWIAPLGIILATTLLLVLLFNTRSN